MKTFSYLGSKSASGAYQAVISIMPPHDTYIETHLGSGAIMLRKPPARNNIGIDIDSKIVANFYDILQSSELASTINVVCADAHTYLREYKFTGSELVYSDPPYLHETRTSTKRYSHDYSLQNHADLLNILKSLPCKVILSGYPSEFYDKTLSDWNTRQFQVMTRGGVRTEKLWFNYDLNSVFWSSFAGSNFTERQRIKRKAERWARNYQALSPGERRAIMAALMRVESITDNGHGCE